MATSEEGVAAGFSAFLFGFFCPPTPELLPLLLALRRIKLKLMLLAAPLAAPPPPLLLPRNRGVHCSAWLEDDACFNNAFLLSLGVVAEILSCAEIINYRGK